MSSQCLKIHRKVSFQFLKKFQISIFGDFSLVKNSIFVTFSDLYPFEFPTTFRLWTPILVQKLQKWLFYLIFDFWKYLGVQSRNVLPSNLRKFEWRSINDTKKLDFCLLCCRLVISFLRNLTSQKMFYDLCNIFWLDLSKWCTTQDKKNILGVRISIALINYSDISKLFIAYFVSFFFSFWLLLYVVALNHALYFAHYGKNKISVQNIFWQKCTLNFEMYKIQSTLFCRK